MDALEALTKIANANTVDSVMATVAIDSGPYVPPLTCSEYLWLEIKKLGLPALGTDTVYEAIPEGALVDLQKEVADKFQAVLAALLIDTENDHNSKDTANRWAKMMITELYRGRYFPPPAITEFPNVTQIDEMYVVGPITIRSVCAHHMVPITGHAWVGVIAKDALIGLSKFHRSIDHISSRPQIQEEWAMRIADFLEDCTQPEGLAVLIRAKHLCCSHRGVKDPDSLMVNSVTRGAMRNNAMARAEFFQLVELSR